MRRLLLPVLICLAALAVAPACCAPRPGVVVAAYSEPFDPAAFQAAVEALMEECPLNAAVAVRVMVIPEPVWGRTGWHPMGLYVVDIEARQPFHAMLDTLIHEWAHAMVWDASEGAEFDGHGPLWGVAQARAYRTVLAALIEHAAQEEPLDEPEEPEDE